MTRPHLGLYWFSPMREPRVLAGEVLRRGPAWFNVMARYRRPMSNFGDALNKSVVEYATGRRVQWAALGHEDLVAIGSILIPYLRRGGRGQIWGSGLNELPDPDADLTELRTRVISLRGSLTQNGLGFSSTDVPHGDPALLVRSMQAGKRQTRSGKILIPHYSAYNTSVGRSKIRYLMNEGFELAPPNLAPHQMIERISRSSYVASSGMHGFILSNALNTPASLISFSDSDSTEPGFKYRDYLGSVGYEGALVPWKTVVSDGAAATIDHAAAEVERVNPTIDQLVEGLHSSSKCIA